MNGHALQVIEFGAVVEAMVRHCETAAGRSLALGTEPSFVLAEVRRNQALLTEAWELAGVGLPSLVGIHDIGNPVRVCGKGGSVGGEQIAQVGQTLGVMTRAAGDMAAKKVTGQIQELAQRLPNLPRVVAEIERCVDGGGEVLDDASTELALLRHRKAKAAKKIIQTIQSYVSGRTRELLSDPVYTTRDGRYVIPLKAENKGKVRGIVHDSSASGMTIYVEPDDVVKAGNELKEIEAKEKGEVERILRHLSGEVGKHSDTILDGLEAATTLDLVFGKVRYGHGGCLPQVMDQPGAEVINARHPLLDPTHVVPMSLKLGDDIETILITGPNTGGKTIAIKSLGLCVAMAQSGMMVFAEQAKLGVFSQLWADIGDEQSVAQSLSTFSGHVKNVATALRACKPGALVLLDEIGAGTDPAEGAALAASCLIEFQVKGAKTMASTHYGELKVMAANTLGFINASMEFDPKTLAPTYKLLVGTPGSSHALRIAGRYGMPENVVERAKEGLTVGENDIARMIEKLENLQRQATKAQSEADRLTARLKQVETETEKKLKEAEQAKQKVRTAAADELDDILRLIRLEAQDVFESIKREPTQANLDKARQRLKDVQHVGQQFINEMRPQPKAAIEPGRPPAKIEQGMSVHVAGLNQKGVVMALAGKSGATVQIGSMKMQIPVNRLTPIEAEQVRSSATSQTLNKIQTITRDISIRELRYEVAKDTLEHFIDDALLAGLLEIKIVHGKGEGILKKMTEDVLRANRQVKGFREGLPEEGGFGVTIATLG